MYFILVQWKVNFDEHHIWTSVSLFFKRITNIFIEIFGSLDLVFFHDELSNSMKKVKQVKQAGADPKTFSYGGIFCEPRFFRYRPMCL